MAVISKNSEGSKSFIALNSKLSKRFDFFSDYRIEMHCRHT